MKKITINKFLFIFLSVFWCVSEARAGNVRVLPYLSLYDSPKYENGFTHFDYANPEAPKGGRIVMPAYGSFDNFNPYIFKGIASPETSGYSTDTLGFSPADDNSTAYPLIAEKFEQPDDHSYIGFFIDKRAKFHDGSQITADDVVFSFNILTTKGSPLYKVYYSDVERVEKAGKHHVRFYFKQGADNRELPLILSQLPIFSAKYWEGKDFSKPVLEPQLGNGPYKIVSFSPGRYTVLERVKDYWAKDIPSRKGFFNFDQLRFDYYQDTTVTLQALFAHNIDLREEYIAKIWVTGYDNDLIKSGKIKKENMPHNRTATLQNFAFNTRNPKFADKRVREAIALAFNFEWANDKLFYNQYKRIDSYFSNSGMEARGKPEGKELEILNHYKAQLDPSVFEAVPENPIHNDYTQTRKNLKKAVKLLQEAGYGFRDGKMTNLKTGETLEFEILSNTANGSAFTRVMLPFIKNLEKIGIKAVFRNIENNIFKNRIDNFEFEMIIISFPMSNMPGNEQREMWGSSSADVKGSYNLIGIKDPVIDTLIEEMIKARKKDDYEAHVRALDRVLRNGWYMIPNWYSPDQRVAYWDIFGHPDTKIRSGLQVMTWWIRPDDTQAAGEK